VISVVVPVYNEESCVEGTVRELLRVLSAGPADYEVIAVDDGSTDGTLAILDRLKKEFAALRVLRLQPNSGQSAAFGAGFRAARGETIVTMDADGQNDPAEIPRLVAALAGHDCCCGYRANRRDPLSRRLASRFANAVRNRVLREDVVDVGCSLKAFKAELVQDLVMWKGMHRFMPALFRMQG
jgi:glycosyltransferase involved in cell wall biosynthesis